MLNCLIFIGLICDFFGGILLIYDIRPTLRDKKTIEEALDRNYQREKQLENKEKNILSIIIEIAEGRKKLVLLETSSDKIRYQDKIDKEHAFRFKWGFIVISIGFLLQIFGTISST